MPFLFTSIILLALLSFSPTLSQLEELPVPTVEIGLSVRDCNNFHYDNFLVLVPFTCYALPILESPSTFVKTEEWTHVWDIGFVPVVESNSDGPCAGPILALPSHDGDCSGYLSGPAAALLITLRLNAQHVAAAVSLAWDLLIRHCSGSTFAKQQESAKSISWLIQTNAPLTSLAIRVSLPPFNQITADLSLAQAMNNFERVTETGPGNKVWDEAEERDRGAGVTLFRPRNEL